VQDTGSGGLGAISAGFPEPLVLGVLLVIILLLLAGIWKLAKIIWLAFSS
jgi:hypothetical protein